MAKLSDFVWGLQREHGLNDRQMCMALIVNQLTLNRLKNGKFDSLDSSFKKSQAR